MAVAAKAWRWMLAAALGVAALAPPARAAWPPALSAQPLVQGPRRCAPGIVPINRRCHVVDFADLGTLDGRRWYYAFYDTHWADRHGRQDRGFPVIFYLEGVSTLRLSLWIDDAPGLAGRWARTAPARPVVIDQPEAVYLGFTLEGERGPFDQRLFRLDGRRWKSMRVMRLSDADTAKLDAATPDGCRRAWTWRYDWKALELRAPLRPELGGHPCGAIVADLALRDDKLALAGARRVR
ncbi:MAG TPA: hypothetical protein VKT30_10000 [Caulobacteraceae bacterium]|nr:hypothetical protein [Caulobacteraceae bacterium]